MTTMINKYLLEPNPIWNPELAKSLSDTMLKKLVVSGIVNEIYGYSTTNSFLESATHKSKTYSKVEGINVELPDYTRLTTFYTKYGLELMPDKDFGMRKVECQIQEAISLLKITHSCAESIFHLVKAIQILRQPEPEFDVSYSHPKIPFTIFVSIGDKETEVDIIRLAESILHETMHLKLSLIEKKVALIKDNKWQYYSPWRDINRPIGGVLHGLYVFKSIKEWYRELITNYTNDQTVDFISWRIETIESEIKTLGELHLSPGLTKMGSCFAKALAV